MLPLREDSRLAKRTVVGLFLVDVERDLVLCPLHWTGLGPGEENSGANEACGRSDTHHLFLRKEGKRER